MATTRAPSATPGPFRFVMAGLLLAGSLANGVNFMAASPLLPVFMHELGLESAQAGLLFSVVPLFATAFGVPASLLSARIGLRATYGVGLLCMAGGLLVLGLPGYGGVLAARALLGVGGSVLPLGSALTVQWFRAGALPVVNSLAFVSLSTGFTVGLGATVLLQDALGWRATLGAYGGFAALVAMAWWLLARDGPLGRPDHAGGRATAPRAAYLAPRTWLLAIGFGGPIACYDTFTAWLPTYYNRVVGFDLELAGALAGVLGFAGVPGALLGGWATARTGVRKPFLVWPGLLLPAVAVAAFAMHDPWLLVAVLAVFGFLAWGFNPAFVTIPMELPGYSAVAVGAVLSVVFAFTGLLVFVTPLVVGALVDATGSFVPGFLLTASLSLALLAVGIALPETGPGRPQAGTSSRAET